MKNAIKYFIKYHISADVLLIMIAIAGIISGINISRSAFPRTESRNIILETTFVGASPSEVEKGVTLKIEEKLDGIKGVKKINSSSFENFSYIDIELLSNADLKEALADVKNAVDRINTFPDKVEKPVIFKRESNDMAAQIMLSGPVNLKTLKGFAKKAEKQLLSTEEISKVEISGFPAEEIEISLREEALDAYKLTFSDIARALQKSNIETTAGEVEVNSTKIKIRANNKKYYASQLENTIVQTNPTGTNILLKDVATLKNQWKDEPTRDYFNGNPAVKVKVFTRLSEDIIDCSEASKAFIKDFNKKNKAVQADLLVDGSVGVRQRTDLLVENGLLGMLLVLLILGLFLKPRIAFWVALSIPISICGMFILAPFFGVNINMLSLFGLILVIGILVDDGVVIAENIYQKYEAGLSARKAAIEGVVEVIPSIISAVITTCLFFSLFFFIEGTMGDFMSNVAFVVISTLLFSLIEGFFILPAHIRHSKDLKQREPNVFQRSTTAVFDFLKDRIFAPVLAFCLDNKMITSAVAVVLMVLSINIVKGGFVETTFFPQINRDDLVVNLTLSPGSDPAKTKAILQKIEKAAWEVNKTLNAERTDSNSIIECIASSVEVSGHKGSLTIKLLDGETRNMESGLISNQIRDKAGNFYEAEELTYGTASIFGAAVQLGFVGDNTTELRAAKNELKQILLENPQLKNVADSELKSGDEFNLSLLPKAKSLGLTLGDIMSQVRQGYFGYQVQSLQRGDDEVKVWLRYENKSRQSFEALQNSKIRLEGKRYTIRELVTFDTKPGVLQINHVNGRTKFQLSASLNDPNASTTKIFNEVKNEIVPTILAKYPSVDVIYEGQSERAAEATGSIQTFLPLILLLVFFTVALTFRSFKQAILVIILIPFSFIGVVAGHWLHGVPISILSIFGILAVAGVVINDSLVLVSTMNRYLKDGMPFRKALYEASLSRFRPIVLTSVTTVAGLMPLVLEKSMQAQFLIPMAISLSYGLMISTFVMLLLLPTWLVLNNHLTRITHWVWTGEELAAEAAEPSIREDEQH